MTDRLAAAITINLPEMSSRVEHGYHLTNEECRWLLARLGMLVPRRKRCGLCDGAGIVEKPDYSVRPPLLDFSCCNLCGGAGCVQPPEPAYEVIT